MQTVFVARYEHRHGSDTSVFKTEAGAEAWRQSLAVDYWEEEMGKTAKPDDPAKAADEYFDYMRDRDEYFIVEELPLVD